MVKIEVFRLEHRKKRDARLTTHVCLASRAFGASAVYYSGEHDPQLEKTVNDVVKNWGGQFKISYMKSPKGFFKKYKGKKIHLTMYGIPFVGKISALRKAQGAKLIIIGGSKVPGWVYQAADFNLSVTGQPHSEVAALSVFLHGLQKGKEMSKKFKSAKIEVIPQEKGKKLLCKRKRKS